MRQTKMAKNKPQNYLAPPPLEDEEIPREPLAPPPPGVEVVSVEPQKPTEYLTAFTMERVKGGWSFVKVTFKDNELISVEKSEPDLKIVVIERIKIASAKYWNSIG